MQALFKVACRPTFEKELNALKPPLITGTVEGGHNRECSTAFDQSWVAGGAKASIESPLPQVRVAFQFDSVEVGSTALLIIVHAP